MKSILLLGTLVLSSVAFAADDAKQKEVLAQKLVAVDGT